MSKTVGPDGAYAGLSRRRPISLDLPFGGLPVSVTGTRPEATWPRERRGGSAPRSAAMFHRRDLPGRRRPRLVHRRCFRRRRPTTAPSSSRSVGLAGGEPVSTVVHGDDRRHDAVLERRGARLALVTTAGFRDVLELRRMRMPHLYDYFWTKPPSGSSRAATASTQPSAWRPTAPCSRRSTRTAPARPRSGSRAPGSRPRGHVPPLHPAHERRLGEILRAAGPGIPVSLSSDVSPRAGGRAHRDHRRQRLRRTADGAATLPTCAAGSTRPAWRRRSPCCSRRAGR